MILSLGERHSTSPKVKYLRASAFELGRSGGGGVGMGGSGATLTESYASTLGKVPRPLENSRA